MNNCPTNKTMKCPTEPSNRLRFASGGEHSEGKPRQRGEVTYPCSRRGKCCDCLAYHQRSGEFPACFFSQESEASYDRSYAALKRDRDKR